MITDPFDNVFVCYILMMFVGFLFTSTSVGMTSDEKRIRKTTLIFSTIFFWVFYFIIEGVKIVF